MGYRQPECGPAEAGPAVDAGPDLAAALKAADRGAAPAERGQLVRVVIEAVPDAVPGVLSVSLTAWDSRCFRTLAASDRTAASLDESQYTADRGPCVDAAREGRRTLVVDLADAAAAFGDVAEGSQVHSVLSIPLVGHVGQAGPNYYAAGPTAFEGDWRRRDSICSAAPWPHCAAVVRPGRPALMPGSKPRWLGGPCSRVPPRCWPSGKEPPWKKLCGNCRSQLPANASPWRRRRVRCSEGTPMPELGLYEGYRDSGLSPFELWAEYVAIGGVAEELEVEAYALGVLRPDDHEHNMIAQALNEVFLDRGLDHPVGYHRLPR